MTKNAIIMNYGFVRVAAAVPTVKIADCSFNSLQISLLMEQAEKEKVEIISFPELSLTGYTCADLFFQQQLLADAERALRDLLLKTYSLNIIAIVGMPLRVQSRLYNVAVVVQSGKVLALYPNPICLTTMNFLNTGGSHPVCLMKLKP